MFRSALKSACSCTRSTYHPPTKRIRFASSSPTPLRLPTIFASASGKGKSAIQILRISGDDALEVWRKMTRPARGQKGTGKDPQPRRAILRKIVHPQTHEILDEGLVLYFPCKPCHPCGPASCSSIEMNSGIIVNCSTNSRITPPRLPGSHGPHAQTPTYPHQLFPNS